MATIHTRIGHDRALCGVNPNRQPVTVVSNAEFLAAPMEQRCTRCARHMKAAGHKITLPEKTKPAPRKFRHRATAAWYRQQPDA